MTLDEFRDEFKFKYDGASMGGPDLDDYEVSLLLTQAVKDLTELAVSKFEEDEDSRRLVSFLMKYHEGAVSIDTTVGKIKKYNVTLPSKIMRILREEPELKGCVSFPEVIVARIDEINTFLNNSFKQPNKRKVVKIEKDKSTISVFSKIDLLKYKITYLPEIVPIIISDLDGESIEGLDVETNTILPAYVHDKLIDIAVAIAIRTVRSSGVQPQ
jgi:hypothetical protein